MRLFHLSALALTVKAVVGYLDTSPFFMFSTSSDFQLTSITGLQTSSVLTKDVYKNLARCPSEYYILVTQDGVSSSDYTNSKTVPVLARNLSPSAKTPGGIQSQFIISELADEPNTESWERVLSENCNAESLDIAASTGAIPALNAHTLLKINLPPPSVSSKAADLSKNDAYLASVLDLIPSKDYTVLYVTNPARKDKSADSTASGTTKQYEMDSPLIDFMHQELKRDTGIYGLANGTTNQTIIDGPLFDKYQFLGPGIFMGFTVGFLLLFILYIGVSALASLQVTYAAFDKETGPLSAKKAQ